MVDGGLHRWGFRGRAAKPNKHVEMLSKRIQQDLNKENCDELDDLLQHEKVDSTILESKEGLDGQAHELLQDEVQRDGMNNTKNQ